MAYHGDDRYATFEQYYRCYPVSFIDKSHLEKGDKIIMPPSALDRLASLHIEYPMLFQLINPSAERVTHCGVLEFVADEGIIYIPYWMMKNMLLQEGDLLYVKNTNLTKATYVKLQPHTMDFLDISNPKAILETSLRSYSCLTTGDTIMVQYNKKEYYIDIVETRPSRAVSIIETDCEVDFAPPLDYEEPKKQAKVDRRRPEVEDEQPKKIARFNSFSGFSRRLDGKASLEPVEQTSLPELEQKQYDKEINNSDSKPTNTASYGALGKLAFESNATTSSNKATPKASQESQCEDKSQEEEDPKLKPFIPLSGSGRRLGGKTSAHPIEVASFPELHQKETDKGMKDSDSKPANIASHKASGKLVCGINAASSNCQATSKTSHENRNQEKSLEEEDPKSKPFIPFSGLGRRLGGKASAQPVEETSRPELKQKETDKETKNFDSSPTNTALCKSFGNLVFGSNVTTSSIQATPKFSPRNKSQENSQKEEELKFKPFTGKKHTLMD
ncbi:ubiquitin recognition factor in ER-associated degradation protein 1-like isoform X1 [Vigna unguiculata]|uniref:ubiquitin recognition factor in ER-associated degradation protein 1-like isoform X1 n=1 Tax=Vigna unguiculata TaxID=3917 RepID=UPI001015CE38|nr:ubiquitin recognition factor in ER-associated degradation protein 1-like isoform X1 [Vigna unguiculata]XP_027926242.1 ubiquitin recognition factor in ER-associated degradation protein 1-like isoform X1 [Vigna unguiculata]XP_027926243.1 ubiquitin recognition factor in ER-associated degradation protein 1-like isoform X1 [Vigna unguiculata]